MGWELYPLSFSGGLHRNGSRNEVAQGQQRDSKGQAGIILQDIWIDPVYDFGSIQSKVIVIWSHHLKR